MKSGSAPGKIILLGEHAVVYGYPAIAAALRREVRVTVEASSSTQLLLPSGVPAPEEVRAAAMGIAREAGFQGGFVARVESEIPLGGGLGSSAALGVALARAFKPAAPAAEAAQLAMHLEKVLHGAPSGLDPATCAHGGVVFFRRGPPPHLEPLSPPSPLSFVVAPTGIARGTKSTVLPLSERRAREPARIEPLLQQIAGLVQAAAAALVTGKLVALGNCMRENHDVLRELGVSCPELDRTVSLLRDAGALGAKLTGAGGGGSAIALAQDADHAASIAARVPGAFVEQVG